MGSMDSTGAHSSTQTRPKDRSKKVARVSLCATFAATGVLVAASPWLAYWQIGTDRYLRSFSGIQATGNLAWALFATGALAIIFGGAAAFGRRVPRYAFFLVSVTSLLLTAFFILMVLQSFPTSEGERLVLISDPGLWSALRHSRPETSIGLGLFVAAGGSLAGCLLSYPLTRYLGPLLGEMTAKTKRGARRAKRSPLAGS